MASLRGDKLILKVQQHSSGTTNQVLAATRSVNLDITAEALETTSQDDGIYATFIGGKVTGTISGEYLLASTGEQYTNLFNHLANGDVIEVELERDGTNIMTTEGVITSIGLAGGNADSLVTGAFSIQLSGSLASA
jgi:predicted secreted protein